MAESLLTLLRCFPVAIVTLPLSWEAPGGQCPPRRKCLLLLGGVAPLSVPAAAGTEDRKIGTIKKVTTVLTAATLAGALAFVSGTAATAAEEKLQAEDMSNAGGQYVIWEDSAAGTVRTLLSDAAAARGELSASGDFTRVEVRAKGELYGSQAPQARIIVDGQIAGDVTVDSDQWKTYSVAGKWAAGKHTVEVVFLNDSSKRGVVLDYLVAAGVGDAPAAQPSTTQAPAAATTQDTTAATQAAAAAGSARVQAESLASGGGQYAIWAEAGADGKVRGLYSEGAIAKGSLTTDAKISGIQLRARAQLSGASAPKARVTVDGKTAAEFSVGKAEWDTYTVPGSWDAGKHSIQVQYLNDEGKRGLVLDYLTAGAAGSGTTVPSAPAPAPSTSQAPAPTATSGSGATQSGSRVAALQPFTSGTFSNVAIGSGAKYSAATDARVKSLQLGTSNVNHERWSFAVVQAKTSDPMVSVKTGSSTMQYRVPVNAATTGGTDKHMAVIQPDGRTAYEAWGMNKVSDSQWTANYVVKTDLYGSGMAAGARASGISQLHGLIRAGELQSKSIKHTIAIGIDNNQLKSVNNRKGVWPANAEDGDSASAYTGTIPMGTMFALPPTVNIDSLGLSAEGKALARALQDYGGHILVRAGSTAIFAEPAADATAVQRMKGDWAKLRGMLRVIDNNTADNIAGGGQRRQPAAPELK